MISNYDSSISKLTIHGIRGEWQRSNPSWFCHQYSDNTIMIVDGQHMIDCLEFDFDFKN